MYTVKMQATEVSSISKDFDGDEFVWNVETFDNIPCLIIRDNEVVVGIFPMSRLISFTIED